MPEFDEVRVRLNALAEIISKEVFPNFGFALIIFEFHQPGVSNYISNAERPEMITVLREAADRLERFQDTQPDQNN